jgi:hypothetical protein
MPTDAMIQYNETNVMRFSFNLLRIKGLYMFRALLDHPQEVLHKRQFVCCMRTMSVDGVTIAVKHQFHFNLGTANLLYTNALYQVPFV